MTGSASPLRATRAAFVFLTRIPVGGRPFSAAEWRAAPAHFPAVGAAVALLAALVFALAAPAGPLTAGLLAVLASSAVTGALHEDGLADTADALGGPAPPARVREILKDPRVGSFGALALVSSVLLRAALLAALAPAVLGPLVLAHGLSRATPAVLLAELPYVTEPERSRSPGVSRAGRAEALGAVAWSGALVAAVLLTGTASPWGVALALTGLTAATALLARTFRRRVGGLTGDLLGAAQQVGECTVLLALAWASGG